MKQFLLILLILATGFPTLAQQSAGKYAGTYEFRFPGTQLTHYIILTQSGNDVKGRYLGCEAGNDTIYYRAQMKNLEVGNDGKISFKLKSFRLSPTPLQPGKEDNNDDAQETLRDKLQQSDKTTTPLFITGGYSFFGVIGKKTIQLQRTADWYDSASDNMKFTRISK